MNVGVKEPVYIIIPVHNRKQITLKCLEHLDKSRDLQQYHVVVVDDGSTDCTTEAINNLFPDVKVLPGDGNLWWTGGIKKGMEYAYEQGAEYFVWLNDDCLVTEKAIPDLVAFCRQSNNSIVGCQGYELHRPKKLAFSGKFKSWKGYQIFDFPIGKVSECDLVHGNLVCIPKAVVEKIGYPNPNITPHYGGDSLFIINARKANFKIYLDNRNKVYNICTKRSLAPKLAFNKLLISQKNIWDVVKLIFNPYSYLSWKLWLSLYAAEYSILGYIFFFVRYLGFIVLPLLTISFLKLFSKKTRWKIYLFKKSIIS